MTKPEKIVCDFVYEFTKKHWNKFKKKELDIEEAKGEFLNKIKKDPQLASWVIFEVAWWGMDKEYLKDIFLPVEEDANFQVLNINGNYIKFYAENFMADYEITFAKKKTKTVTYWE